MFIETLNETNRTFVLLLTFKTDGLHKSLFEENHLKSAQQ